MSAARFVGASAVPGRLANRLSLEQNVQMPDALTAFVIRPAQVSDVAALHVIEHDAARRYDSHDGTRFCTALPNRTDDEHRHAQEHGLAMLSEIAGVPTGFILVVPVDGRAHILELAVALAQQGRGHGRALIAAAEAWAAGQGFQEMTLTTFRDVDWNAPFYARLGYDIVDVTPDRPELDALIADEIEAGVHRASRVAMRKILPGAFGLSMGYVIRQERVGEFPQIRDLIQTAFATAYYAEGDEQDFVERLRGPETYLPELALVAEDEGRLIAHVMLTRVSIDTATGPFPILLLACIAVAAEHRNRGLGSALIEAALERARQHGHKAVILVGDPAYYARLGFQPSIEFGITNANGTEPEYVQLRELVPGALCNVAGSLDLPS
jgi:putative acetyltransferase